MIVKLVDKMMMNYEFPYYNMDGNVHSRKRKRDDEEGNTSPHKSDRFSVSDQQTPSMNYSSRSSTASPTIEPSVNSSDELEETHLDHSQKKDKLLSNYEIIENLRKKCLTKGQKAKKLKIEAINKHIENNKLQLEVTDLQKEILKLAGTLYGSQNSADTVNSTDVQPPTGAQLQCSTDIQHTVGKKNWKILELHFISRSQ